MMINARKLLSRKNMIVIPIAIQNRMKPIIWRIAASFRSCAKGLIQLYYKYMKIVKDLDIF